jgi:hypothetical protein
MTQRPRTRVATPVYNGDPFLADAVASILAQSFREFELIAIDDGSDDACTRSTMRGAPRHYSASVHNNVSA